MVRLDGLRLENGARPTGVRGGVWSVWIAVGSEVTPTLSVRGRALGPHTSVHLSRTPMDVEHIRTGGNFI
jgi:hypothetical protein